MLAALTCVSCYDDGDITDQLKDHSDRLDSTEEAIDKMTDEVEALKALTEAQEGRDSITAIEPITEDGKTVGYTISFEKGEPIKITNGKDGEDGAAGEDRADGAAGEAGESFFDSVELSEDGSSLTIKPVGEEAFTLPIASKDPIEIKGVGSNSVANNIVYTGLEYGNTYSKIYFKVNTNIKFVATTAEIVSSDITRVATQILADKVTLIKEGDLYVAMIENSDGGELTVGKQGIVRITLIDESGVEISKNIVYEIVADNCIVMTYNIMDPSDHPFGDSASEQINDEIEVAIRRPGNDIIVFTPYDDNMDLTGIEVDTSALDYNTLTLDFGDYATADGESITITSTATAGNGTLAINAPNATVKLCG